MTKFEEEFNYLIELSGKVLIGQVDAEAFEKNRVSFFEKYETDQQQALPVVPEFVGKELYNIDFNYWIENKMTFAYFTARTLNWLEQHRGDWNIEYYICKLRFGGYTVEKPQLFYLKNKMTNGYLCQYPSDKSFYHLDVAGDRVSKLVTKYTQKEIDSMQTGSYEKVEVEE